MIYSRPKKVFMYKKVHGILKNLKDINYCLDIGSGNGRLYGHQKSQNYIGIDVDTEILEIAKKRYPAAKFIYKDFLEFSSNNLFDLIICIQVLGRNRNAGALKNFEFFNKIYNFLNIGGYFLFNMTQEYYENEYQNIHKKNYKIIKLIKYPNINTKLPNKLSNIIANLFFILKIFSFKSYNYLLLLKKIN